MRSGYLQAALSPCSRTSSSRDGVELALEPADDGLDVGLASGVLLDPVALWPGRSVVG